MFIDVEAIFYCKILLQGGGEKNYICTYIFSRYFTMSKYLFIGSSNSSYTKVAVLQPDGSLMLT